MVIIKDKIDDIGNLLIESNILSDTLSAVFRSNPIAKIPFWYFICNFIFYHKKYFLIYLILIEFKKHSLKLK